MRRPDGSSQYYRAAPPLPLKHTPPPPPLPLKHMPPPPPPQTHASPPPPPSPPHPKQAKLLQASIYVILSLLLMLTTAPVTTSSTDVCGRKCVQLLSATSQSLKRVRNTSIPLKDYKESFKGIIFKGIRELSFKEKVFLEGAIVPA